jgi:hypothetical protein
MRRAPQEGQKPRFLQLKATSFSARFPVLGPPDFAD